MTQNFKSIDAYLKAVGSLPFPKQVEGLLRLRLPEDQASLRAEWIIEDLNSIGMKLCITVPPTAEIFNDNGLPIPIEYNIPETGWSINNDDPSSNFEGTHLSRGDLVYLSKICKIGREVPEIGWPKAFEARLKVGKEHVSVLNEIWWLAKFLLPRKIVSEYQIEGARGKVDWRFECGLNENSIMVNLEVKRRPSDVAKLFRSSSSALLTKISKKFQLLDEVMQTDSSLNIAAITIYSDIDQKLIEQTNRWLAENRSVDAVIWFSFKSDLNTPWVVVTGRRHNFTTNEILIEPDEEDLATIAQIRHVNYELAAMLGLPTIKRSQQ